jgi:2-methylisocitrate lyase-like PEP mutase family enzyme/uncharacterized protein (DUF427 family)
VRLPAISSRPILDPTVPFDAHSCAGTAFDVVAGEETGAAAAFRPDDPDLADYVILEFAAFEWHEEDEPVVSHPHDPFGRIDVLRSSRHVRIELGGRLLAESSRPMLLFETLLPVRFYLPREDVAVPLEPWGHLPPEGQGDDTATYCAYKGRASYYSVPDGPHDVAWTYHEPLHDAEPVRDRVCFFDERFDVIVDGLRRERPSRREDVKFADLHQGELPLLLPNAWDVPSALALLECGFAAIGTTSFGVASSLGRPDGGRSTKEANLGLAEALRPLGCYISMDIEDGYADDPDQVADYVARLPVDGINVEDSTAETLIDPRQHAAKVYAIKQRSPVLFVNARIDTYWLGQDATVAATLDRAAQYVEAGADGIFVPGATEPDVLRELTAAIPLPVNVLAIPGRSLADLAALGVRRVSTGSLPYRAAIHAAAQAAVAVRDATELPGADPYPEMQERLMRYANQKFSG